MASNKTMAGRIQISREENKLTQQDLADKITKLLGKKVARETINQWESGTRDLKTGAIIALADCLGVTCDYILRGVSPEKVDFNRLTGLSEASIQILTYKKDVLQNPDISSLITKVEKQKQQEIVNILQDNQDKELQVINIIIEKGNKFIERLKDFWLEKYEAENKVFFNEEKGMIWIDKKADDKYYDFTRWDKEYHLFQATKELNKLSGEVIEELSKQEDGGKNGKKK